MLNIHVNSEEVLPPCVVAFGETGVVIIRMHAAQEAEVREALAGVQADNPVDFMAGAVATGKFTESEYGAHPALEYTGGTKAARPSSKQKVGNPNHDGTP